MRFDGDDVWNALRIALQMTSEVMESEQKKGVDVEAKEELCLKMLDELASTIVEVAVLSNILDDESKSLKDGGDAPKSLLAASMSMMDMRELKDGMLKEVVKKASKDHGALIDGEKLSDEQVAAICAKTGIPEEAIRNSNIFAMRMDGVTIDEDMPVDELLSMMGVGVGKEPEAETGEGQRRSGSEMVGDLLGSLKKGKGGK